MDIKLLAQSGVYSDPTPHVEYLTYVLHDDFTENEKKNALSFFNNVQKSISQKDTTADLTTTIGFSHHGWKKLFPDKDLPEGLRTFVEMENEDRKFPSTPGDIFIMIKSSRLDLNYQAAKFLNYPLSTIATLIDDIQGYKYFDDRDLIEFVDGTENPHGQKRIDSILSKKDPYQGGSYLTVQKYVDKQKQWDSLTTEEQEGVIGRTKMNDIEIPDNQKKPYAHNVKSKLVEKGVEIKMLRQNRAWGNALKHGTMFVGFAENADVIEKTLKQMITSDDQGNYDKLLDFVICETGTNYFVPPQSFIDDLCS